MRTRIMPLFAALLIALSACTDEVMQASFANSAKTESERALEKQVLSLNQQTRNIVRNNTVQGAVVGAAAFGILAALAGADPQDIALAAGVGAGVGAVAGNQVGQATAGKNEEIVKQKEIVSQLQSVNGELKTIQSNLRSVLRAQDAEIASLKRQLANEQVSQADVDRRLSAINANRKTLQSGFERAETNMDNNNAELVKLEKENSIKLTSTKRATTSTKNRLASLRKSIALVAE
ncbi:MAG: hypothetical protein AAF679_02520 [Pseudomonadota bacterium]